MLLLVTGCLLLFLAVFPVLGFVQVGDAWETAFMASKLLMLPVGAICLLGAAMIETSHLPHRP
jgi:TRAP-type C4-dicarboxylate transport system permease small subunit